MRKRIATKKLSRTSNERKHLLQGLTVDLIMHESIVTTRAKAQAVKRFIERLVTRAKHNTRANQQLLAARLPHTESVQKLLTDIAPRFTNRNGGYTRLLKLDRRAGDAAQRVLLEWVEKKKIESVEKPKSLKSPKSTK